MCRWQGNHEINGRQSKSNTLSVWWGWGLYSHCCNKIPDDNSNVSQRVCLGPQYTNVFHMVGKGWCLKSEVEHQLRLYSWSRKRNACVHSAFWFLFRPDISPRDSATHIQGRSSLFSKISLRKKKLHRYV